MVVLGRTRVPARIAPSRFYFTDHSLSVMTPPAHLVTIIADTFDDNCSVTWRGSLAILTILGSQVWSQMVEQISFSSAQTLTASLPHSLQASYS